MADPTIDNNNGVITLDMDDGDSNYTLSKCRMTGVFGESTAMILTPQNYTKYDKIEDTDFTNWRVLDNLTRGSTQNPIDDYHGEESSGSDADVNMLGGSFGLTKGQRIIIIYFYDNANSTLGNAWRLCGPANNSKPLSHMFWFGWDTDDATHPTKYLYYNGSGSATSTGLSRSSGWHKLVMYGSETSTIEETFYRRVMYFDGNTIYDDSETKPPDSGFLTQIKVFATEDRDWNASQSHIIDEVILSKSSDVYEQGTAQIDCQPLRVQSFDSVTIDDDTASGMWHGTTTYQFQHSTNGGTSFGALTSLTNANLKALNCAKNGQDVLRIKITHDPDSARVNSTYIPRTNSVTVNFTPFRSGLPVMGAG